jgi:hypothetical protein
LLTVILVAGVVWRCYALATEFWLDEIWSWKQFAEKATSAADIFFKAEFKHDNNHHLNTLFMYLVGAREGWLGYRMLAFVCGILSILVATGLACRNGAKTALFTCALFATSFVMVLYSTEARGYAPVIFFALLAFLLMERYLENRSLALAIGFGCCAVLGFCAHFAFAHFYLGALLWSGCRLLCNGGGWGMRIKPMLWLHAAPLCCAALFYFVVVRSMRIGGGYPWEAARVTDEALAWALGYPLDVVPPVLAVLAALGLVGYGLWLLHQKGTDRWVLYLAVIVVAPALTLVLVTPKTLYARYFILPLTFLLLLLGRVLGHVAGVSKAGVLVAAAVVVAFVLGNYYNHIRPFLLDGGRGQYRQALQDMATGPGSAPITVAVDHSFRTPAIIVFYKRRLSPPREFRMVPLPALVARRTVSVDWVIIHTQDHEPVPPDLPPKLAPAYAFVKSYPCYGPSGMHWFLYRRRR